MRTVHQSPVFIHRAIGVAGCEIGPSGGAAGDMMAKTTWHCDETGHACSARRLPACTSSE